jgi:hypothetical protein
MFAGLFGELAEAPAGLEPAAVFEPTAVVLPAISRPIQCLWGHPLSVFSRCPRECPHNHLAAQEPPWTSLSVKIPPFEGFSRVFSQFLDVTGSSTELGRLATERSV